MKHIILLLTMILPYFASSQHTDAMLFGDVKDEHGKHIPFAHILVKGTTIGTAADETGHFALTDLPEGEITVVAEAMGYKPQEKKVFMKADKSTEVYFVLKQDKFLLSEVVVSADRTKIDKKDAPIMVDVISPRVFEHTQSTTLAEGINFTPGIRVEDDCQNCGFSQIRMNGLEGPYTQILVNSKNIFSNLAGVYGLEQIPSSIIDRIEVVRGGGSALFGSNAIGGTVNIITKEPVKNTFQISTNHGLIGIGYNHPAIDNVLNFNVANVTHQHNLGFIAYGMARNRTWFDANGDNFSEIPILKTQTFGINTFYKINTRTKIEASYRSLHDFRRGGNKFELLPHQSDITEQTEHYINSLDLSCDIFTNKNSENKVSVYTAMQQIHRNSYYGAQQNPDAYGYTDNLTMNNGIQYYHHFSEKHKIISGFDNIIDNLEDHKQEQTLMLNITATDQQKITNGWFIQDELKINKLRLSTGLRYDIYQIINKIEQSGNYSGRVILPRISMLYKQNTFWQYRIGYAMGYRSPQVFDEDLHIEASGAKRIYHKNDPNLTEEKSHSFTSSISYNGMIGFVNTNVTFEGFYTILLNPFATHIENLDNNGDMIYVRTNANNGAYVRGINAEINLLPTYNTKLQIGLTAQQSRYNKPQQWGNEPEESSIYILRSPSTYGYFVFDYNIKNKWIISLSGTYTGSMYAPHLGTNPNQDGLSDAERQDIREAINRGDIIEGNRLEKTPVFFDAGVKLAYDFKLRDNSVLEINAAIKNIFNSYQSHFDKGVYRDASYIYGPATPRSIYLGVKYGIF